MSNTEDPPPLKYHHCVRRISRCQAIEDDCYYARCPQHRDNEPYATGRHCPLDVAEEIMTMNDPTTLRALAARCCAGETTDELRDAVAIALGWVTDGVFWSWGDGAWRSPDGAICARQPNPLTDLNASASAMPAGWAVNIIRQSAGEWFVGLWRPWQGPSKKIWAQGIAPTEPLARTAAALMAMTAELEATP